MLTEHLWIDEGSKSADERKCHHILGNVVSDDPLLTAVFPDFLKNLLKTLRAKLINALPEFRCILEKVVEENWTELLKVCSNKFSKLSNLLRERMGLRKDRLYIDLGGRHLAIHELIQERFFVLKVFVDGLLADPELGRDFLHGHFREPMCKKSCRGRAEDSLPDVALSHLSFRMNGEEPGNETRI